MKFYILLTLIVICQQSFSSSEAKAVISPLVWNFGVISDQHEVSHLFTIENLLSQPLKICNIQTSCSCNAVLSLPPVIEPGKREEFTVRLNPNGKMGKYRWEIALYTDSKEVPLLIIPIEGIVQRDTLLSETSLLFKPFFIDQPVHKKLWAACRYKPDFRIASAQCTLPDFAVSFTPSSVDGFYLVNRGYEIVITSTSQITPGAKRGEVILSTDVPDHEVLRLPLNTYVNGYIHITPKYLAYGILTAGTSAQKILQVRHNQIGTTFKILRVTSSIPEVQARVIPSISQHFYELEVIWNIPFGICPGERREILNIYTDFPKEPLVQIPIQGIITAQRRFNR